MDNMGFVVSIGIALLVIFVLAKTALVVPQQSAYVIERLGKYSRTLKAGFHLLVPFVERAAYKHSLKEDTFDIDEQLNRAGTDPREGIDLQGFEPLRPMLRAPRVRVRHSLPV